VHLSLTRAISKVPLLLGSNHDEGNLFTNVMVLGLSEDDYEKLMYHFYQPQALADKICAQYPLSVGCCFVV
jgi:carboxylesterase type B